MIFFGVASGVGLTKKLNLLQARFLDRLQPSSKDYLMKLVLSLLGVVLLIVAAVYFLVPADQLPSFMPGHEAGVMRMHTKHGVVAGVAGVVLLVTGWWAGRS
jgi:hypothetical protein